MNTTTPKTLMTDAELDSLRSQAAKAANGSLGVASIYESGFRVLSVLRATDTIAALQEQAAGLLSDVASLGADLEKYRELGVYDATEAADALSIVRHIAAALGVPADNDGAIQEAFEALQRKAAEADTLVGIVLGGPGPHSLDHAIEYARKAMEPINRTHYAMNMATEELKAIALAVGLAPDARGDRLLDKVYYFASVTEQHTEILDGAVEALGCDKFTRVVSAARDAVDNMNKATDLADALEEIIHGTTMEMAPSDLLAKARQMKAKAQQWDAATAVGELEPAELVRVFDEAKAEHFRRNGYDGGARAAGDAAIVAHVRAHDAARMQQAVTVATDALLEAIAKAQLGHEAMCDPTLETVCERARGHRSAAIEHASQLASALQRSVNAWPQLLACVEAQTEELIAVDRQQKADAASAPTEGGIRVGDEVEHRLGARGLITDVLGDRVYVSRTGATRGHEFWLVADLMREVEPSPPHVPVAPDAIAECQPAVNAWMAGLGVFLPGEKSDDGIALATVEGQVPCVDSTRRLARAFTALVGEVQRLQSAQGSKQ